MLILAIDTALGRCSAVLARDDSVIATRMEPMVRGHQERLAPLVSELMTEAGADFADLDRIAVTVGPGSFTGLRVGLAFAKGLGVALGKPVTGVGVLQALAADAGPQPLTAAVIDARREQIYLQPFAAGAAAAPPQALAVDEAVSMLLQLRAEGPSIIIGPGAPLLAEAFPGAVLDARPGPDPATVARLARENPHRAPEPLYLRTADAKLPA